MKCDLDHDYFNSIDNEHKAYYIGFLMADGNLAKGSHTEEYIRVSLHLAQEDINILEKFKNDIRSNHKIFVGNRFNDCALRFVSRPMVADLMNYGITPKKTGNEKINLEKIPCELYRHVFRGLIDGDGWISRSYNSARGLYVVSIGICGSYDICTQFTEFCHLNLGVGLLNPSKVKDKNCYKLQYSNKYDVAQVARLLYGDASIYLDRKFNRARQLF